jgi:predicted Zn-dependent protease with MMP-like domain
MDITDQEFDELVTRAMDELPQEYIARLENVAIVYADEPTDEQVQRMKLDNNSLLLGLYEGIPQTARGTGYNLVLPDKITLFKNQILASVNTKQALFEQVKRTLWHEIAHHYGLGHDRIDALEAGNKDRQ